MKSISVGNSHKIIGSPVALAIVEAAVEFQGRNWRRIKREKNKAMIRARKAAGGKDKSWFGDDTKAYMVPMNPEFMKTRYVPLRRDPAPIYSGLFTQHYRL